MEITESQVLLRQALYRFLGGLLLYPESDRFRTLRLGAAWLEKALEDGHVGATLRDQVKKVARWSQSEPDLDTIRAEWVRLFGASRNGFCFPYEGAYLGPEAAGPLMGELQKEYAKAGLVLSINDLPDHVSVELEYMSYLCGLELETLTSEEHKRRARIIKAQYLFLEHHLSKWLPVLAERVSEAEGGAYTHVCEAARELTSMDLEDLRVKAA